MTTTVLGIFDDAQQARRAMEQVRRDFLNIEDLSIITRATESGEPVSDDDHVTAGKGAAVGALWGGVVGLAALLIPGVGPFIAGGALFAGLTGAAAGAIVGGIAGALVDSIGISADEARQYEQLVQEGMTLIAVKCQPEDAEAIRHALASSGAAELHDGQSDEELDRTGSVRTAMYAAGGNRLYADNGLFAPRGNTVVATAGLYATDHMATTPTGDEQTTIGGTTVSRQNMPQPPAVPEGSPPPVATHSAEHASHERTNEAHWSGGQWVGEGQGEGPHDTGVYDAEQWIGEGQEPGKTSGDTWTGGQWVGEPGRSPHDTGTFDAEQWVGEGQGEGLHDTGTFDAEQWIGEGQGKKGEQPEAKRPPQDPGKTRTTR